MLLVVTGTVVLSVLLSLVGVPSAALFGSLLGGIAHALTSPTEITVPPVAFRLGQALIGVTIGTLVSLEALRRMGGEIGPVLLVTLGTVVLSLVAGRLLALRRDVSPVTGAFALVAGGASGIVAVSRELGADDRVVTVVQYLRVLIVLVTMPLVTAVVFDPASGVGALAGSGGSLAASTAYVVLAVAGGLLVCDSPARAWRPSPACCPVVVTLIVAMIVLSALMGAGLAWLTPVDGLTAYLATTPGGLFAVLATAADSGSDVTYVMAVQLFRLLVILLLTPLLARWLRARGAR